MILTIEMKHEPGVTRRMEFIDCWMIMCRYEGIHETNMLYELWMLVLPEGSDKVPGLNG